MNPLDILPPHYQPYAVAAIFLATHIDRAFRVLVSLGGIKGVWASLVYGKQFDPQPINKNEVDTQTK